MGCHTWFFRPVKKGETKVDYSVKDGYTDIDTPHDLFRVVKYPNVMLETLKDTYAFIEKCKSNNNFYIDNSLLLTWELHLKQFWSDNPNGYIEFG